MPKNNTKRNSRPLRLCKICITRRKLIFNCKKHKGLASSNDETSESSASSNRTIRRFNISKHQREQTETETSRQQRAQDRQYLVALHYRERRQLRHQQLFPPTEILPTRITFNKKGFPTVKIFINKSYQTATLNTCSVVSTMSPDMAHHLRAKIRLVDEINYSHGNCFTIDRATTMDFQIGNVPYYHTFHIAHTPPGDIVLGVAFLKQARAELTLAQQHFLLHNF